MTPEITLRAQIVAVVVSVAWLLWLVRLLVRESLSLRSSLAWLAIGCLAVGMSVYPKSLVWFARATGIGLPANALFLFGLLAVFVILFGHTLALTKLIASVRVLAQRIALQEVGTAQHGQDASKPRGSVEQAVSSGEGITAEPSGERDP